MLFFTGSEVPFSAVEKAFNSANASEITSLGKEKFLVNILGKEAVYSQSQATMVLKDFFQKKPVTSFKFTYKGKENGDQVMAVGSYDSKGELFRVTLQFKKTGSEHKIERLAIEK
ncbi:MAG: DUF4783 domain-containing protein [Cryomorphaceae bacterium]|nr:DUF4783 domain-containing protein [Cryomorphaceae bacterium]